MLHVILQRDYPPRVNYSLVALVYSSPENRSHAAWRLMPSASPIRVHVTPCPRSWLTCCCSVFSTVLTVTTAGRNVSRSSSSLNVSQPGNSGTDSPAKILLQRIIQLSQIYTPGPPTSFSTTGSSFRQKEQYRMVFRLDFVIVSSFMIVKKYLTTKYLSCLS